MRLKSFAIITGFLSTAAVLSYFAAGMAATVVEQNSEKAIRDSLDEAGLDWAEVEADGLQVLLYGEAPSEAQRFSAVNVASKLVDGARVADKMSVKRTTRVTAPRFSIELLRNDSGTSLIGLIPAKTNRDQILETVARVTKGDVTDLLQTANYPVPKGWDRALEFAENALTNLPRSKISISANEVVIKAITDSATAKRRAEADLRRAAPSGLNVILDITAPRPVITPFTLRIVKDEDGTRFDACTADTDSAQRAILKSAIAAGVPDNATCTVGLGSPSTQWGEAAVLAIDGLAKLGGGSVTFSDADISLLAAEGTDQAVFDRVVGKLENDLPQVFALHAVLPETAEGEDGPLDFTATLDDDGKVVLAGRVNDELTRRTTESYARARFGADSVDMTARIDETLPIGWGLRVLAALEALDQLHDGTVRVTATEIELDGNTGIESARADISRILSAKLGDAADFSIDVKYDEMLDPLANIPTPEECLAKIKLINAETKITFEPGNATIAADSMSSIEKIAEVLRECPPFQMEIAGYTDSQGREEMNQSLSESRASSVLNELMNRRVLVSGFLAKGYGEQDPIDDNGTEEGREANRRIEFRMLTGETPAVAEEALETEGDNSAEEDATVVTEDVPTDEPD
ncbi:OmpA family protein [Donghicola sp. C2-DW-16]|uniref:OmpA family protein n=1 Tax=Donghicola mangrovi TaxID=2729614 RepID=A0ABX2PAM7_9RHOB|nr:OmpA family protein [Donghicola mangrovi]NVO26532.1 OmpA family protein [Donghicola mangrovi]